MYPYCISADISSEHCFSPERFVRAIRFGVSGPVYRWHSGSIPVALSTEHPEKAPFKSPQKKQKIMESAWSDKAVTTHKNVDAKLIRGWPYPTPTQSINAHCYPIAKEKERGFIASREFRRKTKYTPRRLREVPTTTCKPWHSHSIQDLRISATTQCTFGSEW